MNVWHIQQTINLFINGVIIFLSYTPYNILANFICIYNGYIKYISKYQKKSFWTLMTNI
jgi:hypothetical protein